MALSVGSPINLRGPQGLQGVAGSQVYFITGTPTDTNASARPGDVAFATDTNYIYQRTSSGWPSTGTLLRGAMGLTGVRGASFYSGPAAPTSSSPASPSNGDLYLDLANGEIYRFDGTSWGDQGYSLIGPTGPAGSAGLRGTQIFTGSGAFVASNYANPAPAAGDLYLDTVSANLFVVQST